MENESKAYLKAAFLGFIAVLLIDAFLVFSFMQPLFGFMISVESSLYVEIIFGSIFGAGIQYAKEQMPYRENKAKVYSDLRHVLVLIVLTIVMTYVVVFGSYLPVFPLVLYLLYHLTLGAFYSSLPSQNHDNNTLIHDFSQFISAPLLGFVVTIVFCFSINVIFLMTNPLSSSLFLSGIYGAIAQSIITFFLMDFNAELLTQWKISFGLLGVSMAVLCLSTTPYLPLFVCCVTPMVYFLFRYSVQDNVDAINDSMVEYEEANSGFLSKNLVSPLRPDHVLYNRSDSPSFGDESNISNASSEGSNPEDYDSDVMIHHFLV
ncbi:MAG: hypothetical protein P8L77_02300 [Gammaproteobacteria bacterium]|nr:hypothetical protein [Gammaproteobacteria bacterium]